MRAPLFRVRAKVVDEAGAPLVFRDRHGKEHTGLYEEEIFSAGRYGFVFHAKGRLQERLEADVNADVDLGDIVLRKGGELDVTVLDHRGAPVAGAKVSGGKTDAQGKVRLTELRERPAELRVEGPGVPATRARIPKEGDAVTVRLAEPATLRVRLKNAKGTPIVFATCASADPYTMDPTHVMVKGELTLPNVASGPCVVRVATGMERYDLVREVDLKPGATAVRLRALRLPVPQRRLLGGQARAARGLGDVFDDDERRVRERRVRERRARQRRHAERLDVVAAIRRPLSGRG